MAIKLASTKADLRREEEGDWVAIPDPEWDGVRFQVRSLDYPAYTVARDKLYKRWGKVYNTEPIPQRVRTSEIGKLFARHILLGWEGFDVPYSPEKAAELLADPAYRELVQKVEWAAAKLSQVEVEQIEDVAKN